MTIEQELEYIEKRSDELQVILTEKDKKWDYGAPWEDYCEMREPETSELNKINQRKRMIMPYELEKIPDYGDVMLLSDFIEDVKCGNFIDYDGIGQYIKSGEKGEEDMMTNIDIYPSDIEDGVIRKEFDKIAWFNR